MKSCLFVGGVWDGRMIPVTAAMMYVDAPVPGPEMGTQRYYKHTLVFEPSGREHVVYALRDTDIIELLISIYAQYRG